MATRTVNADSVTRRCGDVGHQAKLKAVPFQQRALLDVEFQKGAVVTGAEADVLE